MNEKEKVFTIKVMERLLLEGMPEEEHSGFIRGFIRGIGLTILELTSDYERAWHTAIKANKIGLMPDDVEPDQMYSSVFNLFGSVVPLMDKYQISITDLKKALATTEDLLETARIVAEENPETKEEYEKMKMMAEILTLDEIKKTMEDFKDEY